MIFSNASSSAAAGHTSHSWPELKCFFIVKLLFVIAQMVKIRRANTDYVAHIREQAKLHKQTGTAKATTRSLSAANVCSDAWPVICRHEIIWVNVHLDYQRGTVWSETLRRAVDWGVRASATSVSVMSGWLVAQDILLSFSRMDGQAGRQTAKIIGHTFLNLVSINKYV